MQIADDCLIAMADLIGLQQGGPFELKHGQRGAPRIRQRKKNADLAPRIFNPGELLSHDTD